MFRKVEKEVWGGGFSIAGVGMGKSLICLPLPVSWGRDYNTGLAGRGRKRDRGVGCDWRRGLYRFDSVAFWVFG